MTKKKNPRINYRKIKVFDKPIFAGIIESINKFASLVDSLQDISDLELSKEFGSALREAILGYTIIRLVTIVDNYFSKTVQEYIDEHKFEINDLFESDQITISLSRLDKIKDPKLTKGQIVATSFNFQNPSEINTAMSHLINDDFFNILKWSVKYHTFHKVQTESEVALVKNWNKFLNMFEIRNELAHNSNPKITIDINYVKNCIENTLELIEKTIGIMTAFRLKKEGKIQPSQLYEKLGQLT